MRDIHYSRFATDLTKAQGPVFIDRIDYASAFIEVRRDVAEEEMRTFGGASSPEARNEVPFRCPAVVQKS